MNRFIIIVPIMAVVLIFLIASIPSMKKAEIVIVSVILVAIVTGFCAWNFSALDWLSWSELSDTLPAQQQNFLKLLANTNGNGATGAGPRSPPAGKPVCESPVTATDWQGKVRSSYVLVNGKVALAVEVAWQVVVRTADGFSAGGDFIRPDAPFYGKVTTLTTGETVKFSGRFEKDENNCLRQGAPTADRRTPDAREFLFVFDDVSPLP